VANDEVLPSCKSLLTSILSTIPAVPLHLRRIFLYIHNYASCLFHFWMTMMTAFTNDSSTSTVVYANEFTLRFVQSSSTDFDFTIHHICGRDSFLVASEFIAFGEGSTVFAISDRTAFWKLVKICYMAQKLCYEPCLRCSPSFHRTKSNIEALPKEWQACATQSTRVWEVVLNNMAAAINTI
jgi:hypothetical protein